MNRLLVLSAAFVLLSAAAGASPAGSLRGNSPGETLYKLTIDQENQRVLHVSSRLVLADDILYMSENGAGQFPDGWAEFVRNLSVTDEEGKAVHLEKLAGARWKVPEQSGKQIHIKYDIALEHEGHDWPGGIDGVAFRKNWGVFYTGRTFLIMNGREAKNIVVDFSLPAGWHVSGSWARTGQNSFAADNISDLEDSMFFAGTHDEFSITRDGFELVFALGGKEIAAQKEQFVKLAKGSLDYYIQLMGGIPNPPPDRRFKKSLVIINAGDAVDGEVIGNHISMIFNPSGGKQDEAIAKFIFAHEFFHLWNGKSILPEDTTEDWFKEGVTSYYTLKALSNTGVIDETGYYAILNNLFYQRYRTDPGFGKASMRDVAVGFDKGKHWGLIYGGGLFVGLCQDIAIQKSSGGKRGLDDLMRDYFAVYGGTTKSYSTLDLENSATRLSGVSQSEFFRKHVFGSEPVPIEKCLTEAGLDASITDGQLRITRKSGLSAIEKSVLEGILGQKLRTE